VLIQASRHEDDHPIVFCLSAYFILRAVQPVLTKFGIKNLHQKMWHEFQFGPLQTLITITLHKRQI